MKKLFVLPLICFAFCLAGQSQSFRINGYAGYVFSDKIDNYYSTTNYYNSTVNGGFLWGVSAEFMLQNLNGIELLYARQDTKAPTDYWDAGPKTTELDVNINNILIGYNRYFPLSNPKIEPYFGGFAGMAIINVENPTTKNSFGATKFSWLIKGGSNFWAGDRFGIKVQAAFGSIVQGYGGGVYFGTGGSGVGVSGYSTLFQFSLSGGIVLKMGQGK